MQKTNICFAYLFIRSVSIYIKTKSKWCQAIAAHGRNVFFSRYLSVLYVRQSSVNGVCMLIICTVFDTFLLWQLLYDNNHECSEAYRHWLGLQVDCWYICHSRIYGASNYRTDVVVWTDACNRLCDTTYCVIALLSPLKPLISAINSKLTVKIVNPIAAPVYWDRSRNINETALVTWAVPRGAVPVTRS